MKWTIIISICLSLLSHVIKAKAQTNQPSQPSQTQSQPSPAANPRNVTQAQANEKTQHVSALKIIRDKCVRCHSGEKPPQGLDLTTVDNMRKGGKRGPAIAPYKPYQSLIWKVITAQDDFPVMPPYDRLSEVEIEAIRVWIYHGAMQTSMSGQEP